MSIVGVSHPIPIVAADLLRAAVLRKTNAALESVEASKSGAYTARTVIRRLPVVNNISWFSLPTVVPAILVTGIFDRGIAEVVPQLSPAAQGLLAAALMREAPEEIV